MEMVKNWIDDRMAQNETGRGNYEKVENTKWEDW
jgi:hypothetical protein